MLINEIVNIDEMPRFLSHEPSLNSMDAWDDVMREYKIDSTTPVLFNFDSYTVYKVYSRSILIHVDTNNEPDYFAMLETFMVNTPELKGNFIYQEYAKKKPGTILNKEELFNFLMKYAKFTDTLGLASDTMVTKGGRNLWIDFCQIAQNKNIPLLRLHKESIKQIKDVNRSIKFFHPNVDDSRLLIPLKNKYNPNSQYTEAFDSSVNYSEINKIPPTLPSNYFKIYNFEVNDTKYKVYFVERDNSSYEILYGIVSDNPSDRVKFTPTNDQKNPLLVLSTVVKILESFLKKYKPNKILFTGDKYDKLGPLYSKMVNLLKNRLEHLGYFIEKSDTDFNSKFSIIKTNKETIEEMPSKLHDLSMKNESSNFVEYVEKLDNVVLKISENIDLIKEYGSNEYILRINSNNETVYASRIENKFLDIGSKTVKFLFQSFAGKKEGAKLNYSDILNALFAVVKKFKASGICTDRVQTPGGNSLWLNMIAAKSPNINLYYFNSRTDKLKLIKNPNNKMFSDYNSYIILTKDTLDLNETASSGGTSAGSVATAVGGLGAGFDPNGHQGIYQDSKKKSKKKDNIIRR